MRRISLRLRRFGRKTDGTMTIEAAFLMPALLITFVLLYVVFDVFRQQTVAHKAANTMVDMLSRETDYITHPYLDATHDMLEWLTSMHEKRVDMRVTVVRYDLNKDFYTVRWSKKRGDKLTALKNKDVKYWHHKLPVMVHNENVIVVETVTEYEPPLNLGFLPREINTFVFARPRFTPQLLFLNGS